VHTPAAQTERFDRVAGTWDEDAGRVALAEAVAKAIGADVHLAPSMKVLDFGCGTGLLSLALRPHVASITGADTSAGMLEVFRQKAGAAGLDGITAFHIEAERPLASAGTFDLIVSSMALHHVHDIPALLATFRTMLAPGGQIALADLDLEDGSFHPPEVKDVHHPGFERASLRALLEAAGFEAVRVETAFDHRRHERSYPVFLMSARTTATSG